MPIVKGIFCQRNIQLPAEFDFAAAGAFFIGELGVGFAVLCIEARCGWCVFAGMAELADAHGSGPCESNFMQVQVLLPAPKTARFYRAVLLYMHKNQVKIVRNHLADA